MTDLEKLRERIERIEARNKTVEIDKDWETSYTRKTILIVFTYLSIGFYMNAIDVSSPWLNAIIPSLGFLLSTLTLPFFKNLWSRRRK